MFGEQPLEWLREHLAANPDGRLIDRIAAWQEHVGKRRVWERCGWRCAPAGGLIKKVVARERDRRDVQAKRATFVARQRHVDPTRLIFLDESGFRLRTPPNYGWAPIGEKAPGGKTTHGEWCTMTMIGALALDSWRGFVTIDSPTRASRIHMQWWQRSR